MKNKNIKPQIEINKKELLKVAMIISALLFAIPSVIYMLKNLTVYKFNNWFEFFLNDSNRNIQTIAYIIVLSLNITVYAFFVKNRDKIFKNLKEILSFVAVIGMIYVCIIPFTCSDVFYYLGVGRIDQQYNQNPYYVTIEQYVENNNAIETNHKDTVLMEGYLNGWANSTVVYGPLWQIFCKIIAAFSFGNINLGLFVFKIVNLILHLLNCYLIYKISNKKKIFAVAYGLNPFILMEGIMCVHNDIFVICFILLGLYFLLKKKNLKLSLIFLAMATAIKYFAILLLPLFIIYDYRNEKVSKRFLKCIQYGLFFVLILVIPYLFYIRDIHVLNGIFTQQTKFAKNFYIIIMKYIKITNIAQITNKCLLVAFIIIYFFSCIVLLFKPKIKFYTESKKMEYFLLAFLFLLITNFQPWYIMWLFPLLMWQKSKNIKLIIQISLLSELANSVFLAYTEAWQNAVPFTILMALGVAICIYYNNEINPKLIEKHRKEAIK